MGKIEFSDRHGRGKPSTKVVPGMDIMVPANSLKAVQEELRTLLAALDRRVAALEKQAARRKRRNAGITSLDPHDLAVRQSIKDTLAKEARAIKKGRI